MQFLITLSLVWISGYYQKRSTTCGLEHYILTMENNKLAATALAQALGLNAEWLFEQAGKKGLDLFSQLMKFCELRGKTKQEDIGIFYLNYVGELMDTLA